MVSMSIEKNLSQPKAKSFLFRTSIIEPCVQSSITIARRGFTASPISRTTFTCRMLFKIWNSALKDSNSSSAIPSINSLMATGSAWFSWVNTPYKSDQSGGGDESKQRRKYLPHCTGTTLS
jgi:hypothetical protein